MRCKNAVLTLRGLIFGLLVASAATMADAAPQKLTPPAAASGDRFGTAVALLADTAVVGAPGRSTGAGAVFTYAQTEGGWVADGNLAPADLTSLDAFGSSLAIDGNTLVVGAPGDVAGRGSAYVFVRSAGGWDLAQKVEPSALETGSGFGFSVALSGDLLVVGALGNEFVGPFPERAFVFSRTAGGWSEVATLTPDDGAVGDLFGTALAISEGRIAVGAKRHSGSRGAVYLFSASDFSFDRKLAFPDAVSGDLLGSALATMPGRLVVGASGDVRVADGGGAAYVFDLGQPEAAPEVLLPSVPAGNAGFGSAVSASPDFIAVAAPNARSVDVYQWSDGVFSARAQYLGPVDNRLDFFARSLGVASGVLLVGAQLDNQANAQAGAAYAYNLPAPTAASGFPVPMQSPGMLLVAGALLASLAIQRRRATRPE